MPRNVITAQDYKYSALAGKFMIAGAGRTLPLFAWKRRRFWIFMGLVMLFFEVVDIARRFVDNAPP